MRRRDAFAFALLGITALAAGAVLPGALGLAAGAELALIAVSFLDGQPHAARTPYLALGVSLLHGGLVVGLRFPLLLPDTVAILEARHALAQVMTRGLAGAFFRFVALQAGPALLAVPLLIGSVSALLRRFPRALSRVAAVELILLGVARIALPPGPLPPRHTPFDTAFASARAHVPALAPLNVAPLPALPPLQGPDTLVVILESVGAENLAAHRAAHPDCFFSALAGEGLFAEVVPAAAVTHIAQPGIVFSRWLVFDARNHLVPPALPAPHLSLPAYFRAKGAATLLASSMDERWLGLDRFTLAEPWDAAFHAGDADARAEVDGCGTVSVPDAITVDRLLDAAPRVKSTRPLLVLLSLQDTHFPYRAEARAPPLDCLQSTRMSEALLPAARDRYAQALRGTEAQLVRVHAAFPQARLFITGDHGEAFKPGADFGHGKDTGHAADMTFLLATGPGIPHRALSHPISALDLLPTIIGLTDGRDGVRLPPGLMDGRDALADPDPDPPILTASMGFAFEVAVIQQGVRFHWRPFTSEGCTTEPDASPLAPGDPRCLRLSAVLAEAMACRAAFAASHLRGIDPCLPRHAILPP